MNLPPTHSSTSGLLASGFLLCLVVLPAAFSAPVAMTGAGTHEQDFNTLPNVTTPWVDDSTLAAWYASQTPITFNIGTSDGTTNLGSLYGFGGVAAGDRALGSLSTGTTDTISIGLLLLNTGTTAVTINSLSYTGEQWRNGGNTSPQKLVFSYQVSTAPITAPGTAVGWTLISSADFTGPVAAATAQALDGNLPANQAPVTANPDISVPVGHYVMLRWQNPNDAGYDHGLGIDNLTVSWVPTDTPAVALSSTTSVFAENAGPAAATGTVSIPAPATTDVIFTLESSDPSEVTVPGSVTIPMGASSVTFPMDSVNDLLADGTQPVAIAARTIGYIPAQIIVSVTDDSDAPIGVSITPPSFPENAGAGAATGTITLAENTVEDLTVALVSSDLTEATVPASVVVPAGDKVVSFPIDAVNDLVADGNIAVNIRATAIGYTAGRGPFTVTDDGDLPPASSLNPGAIAFTGWNADANDDLAFVALDPIPEGTTILFTDNEWNGSAIGQGGGFIDSNEGVITWTAPTGGVTAGTVITLNGLAAPGLYASVGTVNGEGFFNMSGNGETVYAFQGSAAFPTGFLTIIANHGFDSTANTGLNDYQIIHLPDLVDIAAYTGPRGDQVDFADYLISLSDPANWISEDGSGDQSINAIAPEVPFEITSFTVMVPPTLTTQPASQTIPSGSTATLTVTAAGSEPLTYQWYQGISGDTTTPVGTNSASFTTPVLASNTSYWVNVSNAANPAGVNSETATITTESPASDFTWTSDGSAITITGYTGSGGPVGIPATINGLPVTTIGPSAFFFNATVTSFTLPSGLTSIGNYAFAACLSLTDITLPTSVTSIGDSAFSNCEVLTSVIISAGVVSIGNRAFHECVGLTNITIPASVISIGTGPFGGCVALSNIEVEAGNPAYMSVDGVLFNTAQTHLVQYPAGRSGIYTIPVGTTSIGENAFYLCPGLTSLVIPASVTEIGNAAFMACNNLSIATFEGNAPISFGANVFSNTAPGFTINYFSGSTGFTSPTWQGYPAAELPSELVITSQPANQTIRSGSFAVLTVGATATPQPAYQWYRGASGDTSQPLGDGSASLITPPLVADSSFWVRVSNTAGSVDSDAATVTVSAMDLEPGLALRTYDTTWGVENLNPISNLSAVTPSGVGVQIDDIRYLNGSFVGPQLPGLTDPEEFSILWRGWMDVSIDGAGEYTFGTSSDDGSVVFIDLNNDGDFSDPGELIVDNNFLQGVSARVGTVQLPAGLVAIAIGYFDQQFDEEMDAGFKKGAGLSFENLDPINGISGHFLHEPASLVQPPVIDTQPASQTIPNGSTATLTVTASGSEPLTYQWYQGSSGDTSTPVGTNSPSFTTPALTSTTSYWVKVSNAANPAGVNSETATVTVASPVSDFTWTSDGSAITITGYTGSGGAVVIPAAIEGLPVTTIGTSAFQNKSTITSVTLPDSLTSIGNYAFASCTGLTSITIPASLTSIGSYALTECTGLLGIAVDVSNASYSSIDGVVFNKALTNLIIYPGGKAGPYSVPSGVTSIGVGAFSSCTGLTSVTLPASLTSIGSSAFSSCTGLTSFNIPAGVTSIGAMTFVDCSGLTAITVDAANASYSSLDGVLFNKAITVLSVYPGGKAGDYTIPGSVTRINGYAFFRCTGLTSVTIPASVTDIVAYAFYGCTELTSITIPASVSSIGISAFQYSSNLTSVSFIGNAPVVGTNVFSNTAAGFTVYYLSGSTGFTSPTWQGYPAAELPSELAITTQPASQTIPNGSTATLTVTASGSEPLTYQWYQGSSGDTSTPVGNNSASYTTPALNSTTNYWVKVSNSGGFVASQTAVVAVSLSRIYGSVIYFDDFSRGPDNLHGLAPVIAPEGITWTSGSLVNADGSIDVVDAAASATVPFTPENGTRYQLEARAYVVGTSTDWIALGFVEGQSSLQGPFANDARFISDPTTGKAWMLFRGLEGNNTTFLGNDLAANGGTQNPAVWADPELAVRRSGLVDMRIVLDTTSGAGNWKATMFAKMAEDADFKLVRAASALASEQVGAVGMAIARANTLVGSSLESIHLTELGPDGETPAIVTHPLSQTVPTGGSATLSVIATGFPTPDLQWYQGLAGDITNPIPGATTASFTTPALTTSTSYWVRATNGDGSASSETATVLINLLTNGGFESPAIGGNLLSVFSPNSTTLTGWTVSAGDIEIIRPGIWSPSDGLQSLDMSGVSAAAIHQDVSGLIPGANYRITFDLSGNPAKPSELIKQLRVTAAGQSTDFDFDVTSTDSANMGWVGREVTFVATAATERIQFQSLTPGDRGPALDNVALVHVAPTGNPAAITTQPASQTIVSGGTATLTVTAAGDEPLTYQWYEGNSGDTSTPVGTNSASFTTPALTGTTSYWVRTTGTSGTAESDTAVVSAFNQVIYTFDSGRQGWSVANFGEPRFGNFTIVGTFETSYSPTGGNPDGHISSTDQASGDFYFSAPADLLNVLTGALGTTLSYDISYVGEGNNPSHDVILRGGGIRLVWESPVPVTPTAGWKRVALTLAPSSQWRVGSISGPLATSSDFLTVVSNPEGLYLKGEYTIFGGDLARIDNVILGPSGTPVILTQPVSQTVANEAGATLTVSTVGAEPLIYEWFQGASGDTSTPVGTNSATLTTPALTNTTSYWVKVSNAVNTVGVNSETATITVGDAPLVNTGKATAVTEATATLNGTLNPLGLATTARFEYGLTTSYGNTVDVGLDPADGATVQDVSAVITGLEVGQTYHYRLTASYSGGTVNGADAILTTEASGTPNTAWVGLGNQTFPEAIWGGVANWSTGVAPGGTNAIATFGNSFGSGYACTLNYGTTLGRFVYNDPANANDFVFRSNASDHLLTLNVTSGLPSINVAQEGRTLAIQTRIGGNDGFAKNGPGRLVLANGNSTYTGPIHVNGGILEIGGGAITVNNGKAAPDDVEQTFDLGSAGRVGNGIYTDNILIAGGAQFLYNSSALSTLNGVISGGGTLGKAGTSVLALANANTYTGTTRVSGGTLLLRSSLALPAATDLVMEGGALHLGGHNATIRSLFVGGTTLVIDFGSTSGANTLQITEGAVGEWTGNLQILNFEPSIDQLIFGSSAAGIGGNAAFVSFVDPVGLAPGTYPITIGADGGSGPIFPPIVTTQPAGQTVAYGTSATLSVVALGSPAPAYQWYRGNTGDTSTPVGTNSASFTTPALTANASYWVRATNSEGTADSNTALITVLPPSSNANLSSLAISAGALTPQFNPTVAAYGTSVGNQVSSITLTPVTEHPGSSIRVNGTTVASADASSPLSLNEGLNLIEIEVTAQDGTTMRTYTVAVTRAAPASVATLPAEVLDRWLVRLKGSAVPSGTVSVFFEYGPTTAYGSTTPAQSLTGSTSQDFQADVGGLPPNAPFHFRAVATGAFGTLEGEDFTFTTAAEPPVAATGTPSAVTNSSATLVGAVDPKGLPTTVRFEYGLTTLYGNTTASQQVTTAGGIVDFLSPSGGLIPNATYHYRIVATNAAGTSYGEDVTFEVKVGSGVIDPTPTGLPTVTTGGVVGVATESVILQGSVNPNQGTTVVQFQFGLTTAYGRVTPVQGVGNGTSTAAVSIPTAGLQPGTTYHYRLIASNSVGTAFGLDATFKTAAEPPVVFTGDAEVVDSTTVRVNGSVKAGSIPAQVFVDYGPDPYGFAFSAQASPADVAGETHVPVSAELGELAQGTTFYYRLRAVGAGGLTAVGQTGSFQVALLSGLIQSFPDGVAAEDRAGSLRVEFDPSPTGAGWRFLGEKSWREPGTAATGLTSGDRLIEYRPVAGHLQPPSETVTVVSGQPQVLLDRGYTPTGETGSGSLTVTLRPESITDETRDFDLLAKWAFYGQTDASGQPLWRSSEETASGLMAGNHLIIAKPVNGRSTPQPVNVRVRNGETTTTTITYYIAEQETGTPPAVLDFDSITANPALPYAYVGQIRTDAGVGTGFVARPGVVATAGHVVFDDGSLASATGVQWLFQHDEGAHQPLPLAPRGYYLLSGYAAQRSADDTPGTSTPASQNLDAAALYFQADPGRGGFSGYLASDATSNEFLLSDALKTMVGYPVEGIAPENLNRMHATPPQAVVFSKALERTYTTSDIRGSGGASGGPLCVQNPNGSYYPAAIYLGGTQQMVVRAIDSDVVALVGFAESSSAASAGDTGGNLTEDDTTTVPTPELGSLEVRIEPAAARAEGAGWRIQAAAPYLRSGEILDALDPNSYTVQFASVPGFVAPTPQTVSIGAGLMKTVTFTYEAITFPPVITSPASVSGVRGQPLVYDITASGSQAVFTLQGTLPGGLVFDPVLNRISGVPTEAGVFEVLLGASNSGGADSRPLVITSLPVLSDQMATAPYLQIFHYPIVSSESGDGLLHAAETLPPGLLLDPATGVLSGIPQAAGTFNVRIQLTRRGATASAELTLHFTATAPMITSSSPAAQTVPYGGSGVLSVEASGLPAPSYQWYRGMSGDTSQPVEGATSAALATLPLTEETNFWVRISSISGSTDSATFTVGVLPSPNAYLAALTPGSGLLSPPFSPGIFNYSLRVAHASSAVSLTPVPEVAGASVRVQGLATPSGDAIAVAVEVGPNPVAVEVTAADGITTQIYNLTIDRAPQATVSTAATADAGDRSAILAGTVTPNGEATVFFEYGTSDSFGSVTPGIDVSGFVAVPVQTLVTGLEPDTLYYYRLVVTSAAGTSNGNDLTFITKPAPPLAATGNPVVADNSDTTLVGAINPSGRPTDVYFQYGEDTTYGTTTPTTTVPASNNVVDVLFNTSNLTPGTTYNYRLVAENDSGTSFGENVVFQVSPTGGNPTPAAAPTATILPALDITNSSVLLQADVNPNRGTTFVRFEYGLTADCESATESTGVGNGTDDARVPIPVQGLLPGTLYYYRAVASNSLGGITSATTTFTTAALPPLAVTGDAVALGTTRVRISGTVRARGVVTDVYVEYGYDGLNFPSRVRTTPGVVSSIDPVEVSATLDDLLLGRGVFYRLAAERGGGIRSTGEVKFVQPDALVGLVQRFTRELPLESRQGSVTVNLIPANIGGWRFVGERTWRPSGATIVGMANGDRVIEFLPVAGYVQPPRETAGVVSGENPIVLDRIYYETPSAPDAGLQVVLQPAAIADLSVPVGSRAQWRFARESAWRNSGDVVLNLLPGNHLIECRAIPGYATPLPTSVDLSSGPPKELILTYATAGAPLLNPPTVVPYATASTNRDLPYAYVGQFRSDSGAYSGFVVKPRVVATTGEAVFDDATLAIRTGMEWLLQRDQGHYEPRPLIPRGAHVFTGYTAQRITEATPGTLSLVSQNLNVAALYFAEDAGRGGFSGFLTGSQVPNEQLVSSSLKTLIGYPSSGVTPSNLDRMHATNPSAAAFSRLSAQVHASGAIRGFGGMAGGPLCVRYQGGAYYPAAIYLGGGAQSLVRAIDGDIITMFNRAEISSTGGTNDVGGGITDSSFIAIGTTSDPGAIEVYIEPKAARDAEAGWRLKPETTFLDSGIPINNLTQREYILELSTVSGFQVPAPQTVLVESGKLTKIIFTYQPVNAAPTLSVLANKTISPGTTTGAIPFTIGDQDTSVSALSLRRTSSNTALVPDSNVVPGGSGANRTVTVTPLAGLLGSTTITLTVDDGYLTTSQSFVVTVTGTPLETWRFANFGSTLAAGDAADDADPDGDGQNNRAEFAAGTDPKNPADVFRVLSSARVGNVFRVTVPTKPGRRYTLLRGPSPAGPWTDIAGSGLIPDQRVLTLEDPAPAGPKAFYQVTTSAQ